MAQGYGLTETVGGVTLSTAEDLSSGRVGQALPGVRIKLQDWDEGGYKVFHQTGHGPRGEILIGGPMISSGYYDLQEKTSESFIIDPYDGLRWFKTGDIGQLDSNDGGLKLIDRKKDLVKLQMHTDLKCHFQSKMKKKSKMLWHQFFGLITCYRPGSNQIRRNLLLKTY